MLNSSIIQAHVQNLTKSVVNKHISGGASQARMVVNATGLRACNSRISFQVSHIQSLKAHARNLTTQHRRKLQCQADNVFTRNVYKTKEVRQDFFLNDPRQSISWPRNTPKVLDELAKM